MAIDRVGSSSPPPVPSWTPELFWSELKNRIKRPLLSLRRIIHAPLLNRSAPPPDWKECRRIVVFRTDRLGDTLLTCPFVQHLQTAAPEVEICYAVPESFAAFLSGQQWKAQVVGLPTNRRGQARLLADVKADLILDPQTDPEMSSARLALASGARWRIGFSGYGRERFLTSYIQPPAENCHFSEEAFRLLSLWGDGPEWAITPPFLTVTREGESWWQNQRQSDGSRSDDYICFHPGAFFATQRWPLGRFVDLALRVRKEMARNVVWCWGKEKTPLSQQLEDRILKRAGVQVLSDLDLERFASVIGSARLFVGNNSGPLHLACGLGTPTVSMLGPTVPWRWWPLGERHCVLRLDVDCSPCRLGRCSHHTCLKAIDVDWVFRTLRQADGMAGEAG